jgi:hypothetical protein
LRTSVTSTAASDAEDRLAEADLHSSASFKAWQSMAGACRCRDRLKCVDGNIMHHSACTPNATFARSTWMWLFCPAAQTSCR